MLKVLVFLALALSSCRPVSSTLNEANINMGNEKGLFIYKQEMIPGFNDSFVSQCDKTKCLVLPSKMLSQLLNSIKPQYFIQNIEKQKRTSVRLQELDARVETLIDQNAAMESDKQQADSDLSTKLSEQIQRNQDELTDIYHERLSLKLTLEAAQSYPATLKVFFQTLPKTYRIDFDAEKDPTVSLLADALRHTFDKSGLPIDFLKAIADKKNTAIKNQLKTNKGNGYFVYIGSANNKMLRSFNSLPPFTVNIATHENSHAKNLVILSTHPKDELHSEVNQIIYIAGHYPGQIKRTDAPMIMQFNIYANRSGKQELRKTEYLNLLRHSGIEGNSLRCGYFHMIEDYGWLRDMISASEARPMRGNGYPKYAPEFFE